MLTEKEYDILKWINENSQPKNQEDLEIVKHLIREIRVGEYIEYSANNEGRRLLALYAKSK